MKQAILIITTIFLSNLLSAQSQVIFNKINNETYVIKLPNSNPNASAIIQKMATAYNVPARNIKINYEFKQTRQILRTGNKLEFNVNLSNFKVTGHTNYKGFNISEELRPSHVSFNMEWLKRNQKIKIFKFNLVGVRGKSVNIVDLRNVIDSIQGNNYKIKVLPKRFVYKNIAKQKFDSKIALIDKYFLNNNKTKRKISKLNRINITRESLSHLEDINQLYTYKDMAVRMQNFVAITKNQDFYKELILNKNQDPKSLKRRLNVLNNKSTKLFNICSDLIDNLDLLYYDKGMEMLVKRDIVKADRFFNKSIEINKLYAPSHVQLAKLYYNGGYVERAVDKIFEAHKMKMDAETQDLLADISNGIYRDLLLEANTLNNQRHYDDALAVLNTSAQICETFREVRCLPNMHNEFSRALSAKYNMILHDIDLAIKSNKLLDAEKIIIVAKDFQLTNMDYINNDKEISLRLEDLYFKFIDNGNNFIKNRNFENALTEFNEAKRVCNKYSAVNCTKELDNGYYNAHQGIYKRQLNNAELAFRKNNLTKAESSINQAISYRKTYNIVAEKSESRLQLDIQQAIYSNYVDTGKRFLDARNFTSALSNFDKAERLSKTYGIRPNINTKKYTEQAARGLIVKRVTEGKQKVSVNDLRSARQLYSLAKGAKIKYHLEGDAIVRKRMNELKDLIFKQECINAQNKYNDLFNDALNQISQKHYIKADQILTSALQHSQSNFECDINTENSNSKKREIAPAVNFMMQINDVHNNISSQNYQGAINKYIGAGKYFSTNKIQNFGLSYSNLYDFISAENSDFINYSVGYYTNKSKLEKAVLLIKILSSRDYKRKLTKTNQKALGTAIASRDYKLNRGANYKTNIVKYTGNDKYFKYFKKSYKKQWKALSK